MFKRGTCIPLKYAKGVLSYERERSSLSKVSSSWQEREIQGGGVSKQSYKTLLFMLETRLLGEFLSQLLCQVKYLLNISKTFGFHALYPVSPY